MKTFLPATVFLLATLFQYCKTPGPVYTCGSALSAPELRTKMPDLNFEYSDADMDMVTDINTYVMGLHGDSIETETFMIQHTSNSMLIEVNGAHPSDYDRIACFAFSLKQYPMPENTVLLFYKYMDEKASGHWLPEYESP